MKLPDKPKVAAGWLASAFVVYAIVTVPEDSGGAVQAALGAAIQGGKSILQFFGAILN